MKGMADRACPCSAPDDAALDLVRGREDGLPEPELPDRALLGRPLPDPALTGAEFAGAWD